MNRINDDSPRGVLISTQAAYDIQGLTPGGERKGAKGAKHKQDYKFEARNPKYETNSNDIIPNHQNYRIE